MNLGITVNTCLTCVEYFKLGCSVFRIALCRYSSNWYLNANKTLIQRKVFNFYCNLQTKIVFLSHFAQNYLTPPNISTYLLPGIRGWEERICTYNPAKSHQRSVLFGSDDNWQRHEAMGPTRKSRYPREWATWLLQWQRAIPGMFRRRTAPHERRWFERALWVHVLPCPNLLS